MKFEKIIYMETIPTVAFGNVRMGTEGSLEEGESMADAFRQAKNKINESYNALYGSSHFGNSEGWSPPIAPQTILSNSTITTKDIAEEKSTADRVIEQINQCSELVVLESFRLIAERNPKIADAYNQRCAQLQYPNLRN